MKAWATATLVLAAFAVGCGGSDGGSDEPDPAAGSPGEIEVVAGSPADEKVGNDLKDYLVTNCPTEVQQSDNVALQRLYEATADFCGSVETIEAEDTRITVRSRLDGASASGQVGDVFCLYVMGSDVADFTAGHTLISASGEKIETCQAPKLS